MKDLLKQLKPKRNNYGDVRSKLFDGSLMLSRLYGLNGWTIETLAEHVGFPRGNLFYYCRKKEELLEEVVDYILSAHRKGSGESGSSTKSLLELKNQRLLLECQIYKLEHLNVNVN